MFQPNPPTPKAMSDDALNAKIAEVQLQPDGLVAAMALIEEQSRLRQEDALALSKWQLEAQMHAATEVPASQPDNLEDPAVISKTSSPDSISVSAAAETQTPEPEIDIFANVPPVVATQPETDNSETEQSEPAASENIDDVVAALNASYAQVATEPDLEFQKQSEIGIPAPAEMPSQDYIPEPVESPVVFTEPAEIEDHRSVNEPLETSDQIPVSSKASALSWSWLAVASTPATLLLAAFLKDSGASLAQAFVLLAGILIGTSLLSSVGSVASARGASSLTVISRAAFGVWGNSAPVALVLLAKLLWTAALVYFAARIISPLVSNQPWFANIASALVFPAEFTAMTLTAVPLLLIAAVMATLGGVAMLRFQQVATFVSVAGVLAIGFFVVTSYSLQDLDTGGPISSASLLDLSLLALAIFGFASFSLAGDFAKNLPLETPSAKVFFLSFIFTFFVPLLVGTLGLAWLYMAQDTLESSFTTEALATVAGSAPMPVFVLFAVAIGVSLVYLVSLSMHSISLNRIGLAKLPEWVAQLGALLKVATVIFVPSYLVAVSVLQESIFELLLVAAVVAAAWAGIVVADALIRSRGYHEVSLTREYGFYGKANPVNLLGFFLAIALGLGYLEGGPQLSFWAGYLGDLTPQIFEAVGSNIGIAMAFGLAVLFPVLFGIPRIRKQEHNLSELDLRRQELKEFLDSAQ